MAKKCVKWLFFYIRGIQKLTLFVLMTIVDRLIYGQNRQGDTPEKKNKQPMVFLVFGTVLDNSTRFAGIQFESFFFFTIWVLLEVGDSALGVIKFCLNGHYYFRSNHKGWAFGGFFTFARGVLRFNFLNQSSHGINKAHVFCLKPIVGLDL